MSGYTVNIETLTSEIKKLMEQFGAYSGGTITPNNGSSIKSTGTLGTDACGKSRIC